MTYGSIGCGGYVGPGAEIGGTTGGAPGPTLTGPLAFTVGEVTSQQRPGEIAGANVNEGVLQMASTQVECGGGDFPTAPFQLLELYVGTPEGISLTSAPVSVDPASNSMITFFDGGTAQSYLSIASGSVTFTAASPGSTSGVFDVVVGLPDGGASQLQGSWGGDYCAP